MPNGTAYKNWYNAENYDRINLVVPKGSRQMIQAEARRRGISTNEYLVGLIPKHLILERSYVGKRGLSNELLRSGDDCT